MLYDHNFCQLSVKKLERFLKTGVVLNFLHKLCSGNLSKKANFFGEIFFELLHRSLDSTTGGCIRNGWPLRDIHGKKESVFPDYKKVTDLTKFLPFLANRFSKCRLCQFRASSPGC
jgi:hypothetical protein